jgi:hypothetical protein
MSSQLIVGFIEVTFDGRVLDGSVHPFDLAVGPGVLGLGQPMIDIVEGAGVFEGMRVEELPIGDHLFDLSRRPCFASGVGEVGPVVGEDGMDPVGDGLDQVAQEVCGRLARHLFVQLDEGELRGPVDGDDEMELSLSGSSLGDVDMEVAVPSTDIISTLAARYLRHDLGRGDALSWGRKLRRLRPKGASDSQVDTHGQ